MDLDAYVQQQVGTWRRLEDLVRRRQVSGAEADELVELYEQTATHLSVLRSQSPDPTLVAYLSSLLSRARSRAAGTRQTTVADVADFVWRRFPAALYRTSPWWVTTMVVSYLVAAGMTWWLLEHPQVESGWMDPAQIDQLVREDFEDYYSQSAPAAFAAKVWTNNAWVAAVCLGGGILGLPVIWMLWQNLLNIAVMASIMIRHDRAALFFGLITPHGLLELTAVFIAAGVGLRVFWAWVAPGDVSRAQSVARYGRLAGGVALGLVLVLLVSGVIEAFVTPSGLPTWARIGVGVCVEVVFLAYVFVVGRRAARAGWTGDVTADQLAARAASAG